MIDEVAYKCCKHPVVAAVSEQVCNRHEAFAVPAACHGLVDVSIECLKLVAESHNVRRRQVTCAQRRFQISVLHSETPNTAAPRSVLDACGQMTCISMAAAWPVYIAPYMAAICYVD